jgi:hypothetical protein
LKSKYDIDYSKTFAASVANFIFCQTPVKEVHKAFVNENVDGIEECLKEVSTDDTFCLALTCAAYNYCYGRYIHSGHRMGFFFHSYLGYIRALNAYMVDKVNLDFLERFIKKVGYENIEPFVHLCQYSLYRILPNTPNSKDCHTIVVNYAKAQGVTLK